MKQTEEEALIEFLAEFELDPLGFALCAFPWGEPGPLENEQLEDWQYEYLDSLGKKLREGIALQEAMSGVIMPIKMERSTGHGVGKSALASILCWWAMSTMQDTKGVVTANTETQLKTKTWPEIAKWHRLFIAKELFEVTATAIFPRDAEYRKTWRIDIVPWSIHNTEAFAGLHNIGRRIFLLMDEGSSIPDMIWQVAEGAMTDANTQIIWAVFGNPTLNTGIFRENAPDGKFGKRWNFKSLDSRSVSRTNKQQIADWEEDWGEDSDFFRVRVKGVFPRQDAVSFISYESAKEATHRELPELNQHDFVLGVDVARFGDDCSVIYPRRGRDARTAPPQIYRGLDTMELAYRVRDAILHYHPTVVCVDGTGVGAGVVDRLNEMRLGVLIYEVTFGGKPNNLTDTNTFNVRADIWAAMREWLSTGCIPATIPGLDHTLIEELTGPTYGFASGTDAIQLESKKDMRRRGIQSPDVADALACTFALSIIPAEYDRWGKMRPPPEQGAQDYNPLEAF